jgi:hypothetical protein
MHPIPSALDQLLWPMKEPRYRRIVQMFVFMTTFQETDLTFYNFNRNCCTSVAMLDRSVGTAAWNVLRWEATNIRTTDEGELTAPLLDKLTCCGVLCGTWAKKST